MDFNQIEAYIKTIELKSFSKAADSIFLSQSSISLYISALEKKLNTKLVNRLGKEITPTYAGKLFYEDAKELVRLKDNSISKIKDIPKNFNGNINILASTVPSQYILPKVITDFNKKYPNISFCVKQSDSQNVINRVKNQEYEIGIIGNCINNGKLKFGLLGYENIIFIAPINKSFETEKIYDINKLLLENIFISREEGSGTRNHYEEYFLEHNIDLNKIKCNVSFDNTQSIISAVMNGLGIAMVSNFAAKPFIENKMILQIHTSANILKRNFYYVLRNNLYHSHITELFVNFLKNTKIGDLYV
ncbi:MAG: selenium metabolism-associated LysR family transcriptional regulator [Defluviitaleaceae bacterium]|nr:selenium metabolism-associated LysR family transcriptional regulator [Defluviitaleaceae bacterium]